MGKKEALSQRARWALAVRDATQMQEDYTTKDWAELLMYGVKPYNKTSKEEVLRELVEGIEDSLGIQNKKD